MSSHFMRFASVCRGVPVGALFSRPSRLRRHSGVTTSAQHSCHVMPLIDDPLTQLGLWATCLDAEDHEQNLAWVKSLSTEQYQNDILVVAGDISDSLAVLKETFELLLERFHKVAFVPGNHELWVTGVFRRGYPKEMDSMKKLNMVLELCSELGVLVEPTRIGNLLLVPLFSWHHQSFDAEPDVPEMPTDYRRSVSDYRFCKWSSLRYTEQAHGAAALAQRFDALNDDSAFASECDVISFSHFVPRPELIPEKKFLTVSFLAKIAGSRFLQARLEQLKPHVHVFGHTHIAWDATLDGVRYAQYPLANPRERRRRPSSIAVATSVFDPRIHTNNWPASWDSTGAEWLPVKIYTYGVTPPERSHVPTKRQPLRLISPKGVKKPPERHIEFTQPRVRHGVLRTAFTKWGEHYKNAPRLRTPL